MSLELTNFEKQDNNIPYISKEINIGNFLLKKSFDQKIIEDAKVACCIYGIKNLEELKSTNKKIIVVIPALTGTQNIFSEIPSQGDGWANTYGKPGNILDPNENIIIGLNYFGSLFNNDKEKHNLDFYPVSPQKQVEAWKKALKELGIQKIDILFGGSNGGGHIHHWILDENKDLSPNNLIPVAGPITPSKKAKEFFKIKLDLLEANDSLENISNRLEKNLENLKKISKLFDELIKITQDEILSYNKNKDSNSKKIMKIVRQIGFLKFVGPEFFDKFTFDKNGNKLEKFEEAKENMMAYFKKEGSKFEKRFGKSYLKILLKGIVEAPKISPEEYAQNISEKIDLIIIGLKDDSLFEEENLKNYFEKVEKLRGENNHPGKTIYESISGKNSQKAAHDYFLWEEGGQIISNKIKQILNGI